MEFLNSLKKKSKYYNSPFDHWELNEPLTEIAIEEICKTLPKLIDLISQNEAKIIDEVNQRINNHESKYKHMINCTSLKCDSS